MIPTLETQGLQGLDPIRTIPEGSDPLRFEPPERSGAYPFVSRNLRRLATPQARPRREGVAQTPPVPGGLDLAGAEDREDVLLLAEVDALGGTLSGPAIRKLCERAGRVLGEARFERLAGLSNGHLYSLRHSPIYTRRPGAFERTPPSQITAGERRKPRPEARPGLFRCH